MSQFSLEFDGSSGNVNCGSNSSIDNVFTTGGSIRVRVNVRSDGEGNEGRIIDKRHGTSNGYTLYTSSESGGAVKLSFLQEWTTTNLLSETIDTVLTLGQWHDVYITYDTSSSSNVPTIYVDQVEVSLTHTTTASGSLSGDASELFYIGNRSAADATFDGFINLVELYDKELSLSEIQNPRTFATFDGTDDFVDVGSLSITNNWTASVWCNTSTSTPGIQYPLSFYNKTGIFVEFVNISDAWGVYDGVNWVSGSVVGINNWNHLCVVKNGTTYSIYLNGVLENSGVLNNIDISDLNIGRRSSAQFPFTGKIGQTKIFDSALSDTEVADLFADSYTTTSPKAQYDFDEGSGTTIVDKTGNGYTGTATNTTAALFWAADPNLIEAWYFTDGTGSTLSAFINGVNDGSITTATWIDDTSGTGSATVDSIYSRGVGGADRFGLGTIVYQSSYIFGSGNVYAEAPIILPSGEEYIDFFLNSKSSIVELELIEIEHPLFSQIYRVVRNAVDGVTVTLENGDVADFEYYPLALDASAVREDLDFAIKIKLGDLGEVIPKEIDNVSAVNSGFSSKPTVKFRTYRSDDLAKPMYGPIVLEITEFNFNREGAEFEAKAPLLNISKTGEVYTLDRFPMMRGFV